MERLTNSGTKEAKYDVTIREVLNKLAEYEDTGLSPGQIKELTELQKSYLSGLELAQIWAELEKLKEYRHLEEQSKLLKLPCAVGDTVYVNHAMQGGYFKKTDRPYEVKVVFIGINGVGNYMHVAFDNGCRLQFWFSDIGRTVFLTKEEAEAALKCSEGGKGK